MTNRRTALDEATIAARLASLPGWTRDGGLISKTFTLESYIAGVAFAAAVGTICEGLDHHPEQLCIGWQKVTVSFTTHSAGDALTALDFDTADSIEALPLRQP